MAKKATRKKDERLMFSYPGYDPLSPSGGPELVIGIVGPAGVDRNRICEALSSEFYEYGYIVKRIKLSSLITLLPGYESLPAPSNDESLRIPNLMNAGNEVRALSEHGDALAILGISEIQNQREKLNQDEGKPVDSVREKTVYILDSLKHPEELSTLRATYGQGSIVISAYSRRENRVANLAKRIAQSKCEPQGSEHSRSAAESIINRDENEENEPFGQNVESCFPKADFFLDLDVSNAKLKEQIDRHLQIIFDNPFITPSKDESGMFHAEAASWRSSDLARQVGSSISNDQGDIIALGCNEVPKAFGGLYWEDDAVDGRDFQRGFDEGAEQKRLMLAEIFRRMSESDEFDGEAKSVFENLVEKSISGAFHPLLNGLQALNVIEYGRTVHAEMAALMDATSRGISVKGCTMYVNTFPCHICARHIIAAGIKRVVYVEPYPKSLSGQLFKDSVSTDKNGFDKKKVTFEAFKGVAPRAYQFSFKLVRKRKDESGFVVDWKKSLANTKLKRFVTSYMAIENQVVGVLLNEVINKISEGKNNESQ